MNMDELVHSNFQDLDPQWGTQLGLLFMQVGNFDINCCVCFNWFHWSRVPTFTYRFDNHHLPRDDLSC